MATQNPRAELAKSILSMQAQMGSGIRTPGTLSPLMGGYGQYGQGASTADILPRSPLDTGQLGPGQAIYPGMIDPRNPKTGRSMPRLYEYQPGYNLLAPPGWGKLAPFPLLRNLANVYDIARRCIEIRKQEVSAIEWDIEPRDNVAMAAGKKRIYAKKKPGLTDAYATERKKLREWFSKPDRNNGLDFSDWMKSAMEEVLVTDALAIYEHPTWGKNGNEAGGDLFALELLDGATIKPLIDYRGARPAAPHPAYQQFLFGIPRVDLLATMLDARDDPEVQAMQRGFDPQTPDEHTMAFTADQISYRPYVPRTWTKYGFSCTEQVLVNTTLALSRQAWHKGYFDDGDVPAMLIHVPDTWNLDQINRYEQQWHAMLSGDQGWKHRVRAIPGVEKAEQLKPPFHQMDFDEFLLKVTCLGYDMDPAEVGFSGSRGDSQNTLIELNQRKYRTSLRPMMRWFQNYFDDIISRRFHLPELVFRWEGLEIEDEKLETEIDLLKVKAGAMSLDQFNGKRGIEPMGIPQAATPNVYLTRDVVPLASVGVLTESPDQVAVSEGQPAGKMLPAGNAANPSTNGAGGAARANASPTRGTPARVSPAQPGTKPASTAQKVADAFAELRAFEKFLASPRTRRFVPEHLPLAVVEDAYARVEQGEAVKTVFADLRKTQEYASDAIVSEIVNSLL